MPITACEFGTSPPARLSQHASALSLMLAFRNPGRPQRNGAATAAHPPPDDLRQAFDAINHDN